jgi:2-octaprenyl-6-methoxyphenol hydroxylase
MQVDCAEVVVVGGGPAGLTTALALACGGVETALVARPGVPGDNRTTALLAGSVNALRALGVWESCVQHAAPLRTLRIVDDTARLLRAPEVHFEAQEIGLDAFGYNIENRHLIAALEERLAGIAHLSRIPDEAAAVTMEPARAMVTCRGGTRVAARLLVGADGRHSLCRAAAGIALDARSYPQLALTWNLGHGRPHDDTSTELHTETGPFTMVPLPGRRSSLVMVIDPPAMRRLEGLADAELAGEIERRSHSILGKIMLEPGRGAFPLMVATARNFTAHRLALVGEAAHAVPPIGAQGLNLGLRDAVTLAELVRSERSAGADVGSLTDRYEHARRADVASRTFAVDVLNRSLLSDFLPLQGLRGLGLHLLQRLGPLRRAVMREGVMPLASQPRLMRGPRRDA